jgi:hypothetical protein
MTETDSRLGAVESSRGLDTLVPALAAEFPDYFIGTQPTWNGVSLSAHDKDRAAHPGVYAVVTDDPDEMRRALREGHQ